MNWRLSQLDRYTLVSNSDCHSFWPWRMGREATIFDINLSYKELINALRTKKGYLGTLEVDPNYGKYHFDGHRACNVCLHPTESLKLNNICPNCKKPLTVGVLQRVEELADRPENYRPEYAAPFYSLIPLSEIISMVLGKGIATKEVWKLYYDFLELGENELNIMINLSEKDLASVNAEVANIIIRVREGKLKIRPGYDGEYGVPEFGEKRMLAEPVRKQTGLGEFL